MASTPMKFVICLRNKGYEASLEQLKLYRLLPDREAEKHSFFSPIELPQPIRRAIQAAI